MLKIGFLVCCAVVLALGENQWSSQTNSNGHTSDGFQPVDARAVEDSSTAAPITATHHHKQHHTTTTEGSTSTHHSLLSNHRRNRTTTTTPAAIKTKTEATESATKRSHLQEQLHKVEQSIQRRRNSTKTSTTFTTTVTPTTLATVNGSTTPVATKTAPLTTVVSSNNLTTSSAFPNQTVQGLSVFTKAAEHNGSTPVLNTSSVTPLNGSIFPITTITAPLTTVTSSNNLTTSSVFLNQTAQGLTVSAKAADHNGPTPVLNATSVASLDGITSPVTIMTPPLTTVTSLNNVTKPSAFLNQTVQGFLVSAKAAEVNGTTSMMTATSSHLLASLNSSAHAASATSSTGVTTSNTTHQPQLVAQNTSPLIFLLAGNVSSVPPTMAVKSLSSLPASVSPSLVQPAASNKTVL